MPRVERIEYEDAFYHVMNRGRERGRVKVYRTKEDYEAFLQTLEEAVERFGIVIHAYCLMSNHYHLLLQTPRANLSRAMRHINGVYTQRYNRLHSSDGPLFRGRFKSILVDSDAYLLQLSRYIHRNPIETQKPIVDSLVQFPWSSYPAYVNKAPCPDWLTQGLTYQMLGSKQRYAGYARYVANGNNEQLTRFYGRGNLASIIGDKEFVSWYREEKIPEVKANKLIEQTIPYGLSIAQIVEYTANYYQQSVEQLRKLRKGRASQSTARKVAIYLCQHLGDHRLEPIKGYFGLGHVGSVSYITSSVKREIKLNVVLKREIELVVDYIINNAT
jgi:REP-associated tyrosine transposase